MDLLRNVKFATLNALRSAGAFERVASSSWRRNRLLILCYHGTSLDDEHLWRPRLYMPAQLLEKRLEALREMRCCVLPLGEALSRLRAGTLPRCSVAITFDDGTYDFYAKAYPLLKKHGFPVTVYQTTYYTDHAMPVFNLICSYMLWKNREQRLDADPEVGLVEPMDLRSEQGRHRVVRGLIDFSEREKMNGSQKNELARHLAGMLGIDYAALVARRVLQLMNEHEVAEVGNNGVDLQLHTHRHRTPDTEEAFRKEIRVNRERIHALTGQDPTHFCYPSGVYRQQFAGWMEKENVVSATTCDAGLVSRDHAPYLLPRFVDSSQRTDMEFDSWLSGVGYLLALRRTAPQVYIPFEE